MTYKEEIISLLTTNQQNGNGKMSLKDMEKTLRFKNISTIISNINHDRRRFQSIRILRSGKNGHSSYEIQNSDTDLQTIMNTMQKKERSVINGIGLYRDVSLLAVANTASQEIRNQLVKTFSTHKNIMMQKIAIAVM